MTSLIKGRNTYNNQQRIIEEEDDFSICIKQNNHLHYSEVTRLSRTDAVAQDKNTQKCKVASFAQAKSPSHQRTEGRKNTALMPDTEWRAALWLSLSDGRGSTSLVAGVFQYINAKRSSFLALKSFVPSVV